MIKSNVALAENIDFDIYDSNPIDSFGKNILFKFNSNESNSIGNKRKADIPLIEYKPRSHRTGLGHEIITNDKHKPPQIRNYYGTKIRIIHGKHKNLKGIIIDDIRSDDSIDQCLKQRKYITIQLKKSKEVIKVEPKNIKLRTKDKEIINISPTLPLKDKTKLTWIQQGLIVRIINKESQYYNSKVKVEDLYDEYTFSIVTNDNVLHTTFSENDCETIIPKENEDVMIVINNNIKGQIGKLINRNKKNNSVVIQLYDDLSIITLTQDDVCSFIK